MNKEIKLSHVSIFRLFNVASRLYFVGGTLKQNEKSTYRYLFNELDDIEQNKAIEYFGDVLGDVMIKYDHDKNSTN